MDLLAPQPLAPHHSTVGFDCGDSGLNRWLLQRAHSNQQSGATRSFVVCNSDGIVKAYVALASGAVAVASAPGRFRRNMPDPIPVVVLARLAVCRSVQGRGIARALLADAFERVLQASDALRGTDQKGKVAATSERRISRVSVSMGEGSKPMCR